MRPCWNVLFRNAGLKPGTVNSGRRGVCQRAGQKQVNRSPISCPVMHCNRRFDNGHLLLGHLKRWGHIMRNNSERVYVNLKHLHWIYFKLSIVTKLHLESKVMCCRFCTGDVTYWYEVLLLLAVLFSFFSFSQHCSLPLVKHFQYVVFWQTGFKCAVCIPSLSRLEEGVTLSTYELHKTW